MKPNLSTMPMEIGLNGYIYIESKIKVRQEVGFTYAVIYLSNVIIFQMTVQSRLSGWRNVKTKETKGWQRPLWTSFEYTEMPNSRAKRIFKMASNDS